MLTSGACHAQILLQCDTRNHKQIQLLDLADTLQYKFGKNSQPELIFSVPKNQAIYMPWRGVGRTEYYSIELQNQEFTYHLYSSLDRMYYSHSNNALTKKPQGGVSVDKQNQSIAQFECLENAHYINHIEDAVLHHLDP